MPSGNWAASRWSTARYSERHPRQRCGDRPKTRKKFPVRPGGFLDLYSQYSLKRPDRIGRSPSTFPGSTGPAFPNRDAFDVAAFGPDLRQHLRQCGAERSSEVAAIDREESLNSLDQPSEFSGLLQLRDFVAHFAT